MVCKVNTVAIKDVNVVHIAQVAETIANMGIYIHNIIPHISVDGSAFAGVPTINKKELDTLRDECSLYLNQMRHCRQCRADAVGTLENDRSIEFRNLAETKRFGVASKDGRIVDEHFGHAETFYIYESDGNTVSFVGTRNVAKYCLDVNICDTDNRNKVFDMLSDCDTIIALRIGLAPANKLQSAGKRVISTYEYTETAVLSAAKHNN
jgi:MoaA/NifB/PqqE/SkfB family radical SAM enzyme